MKVEIGKLNLSHSKLHELDCVGSCTGQLTLCSKTWLASDEFTGQMCQTPDCTCGMSQSVTEAHGSAKTWPDGNLTAVKSHQDL